MAYNKDIPQPQNSISGTQPKILDNFQAIGTWTAVDHVGFDLANAGKHNKVTLIAQGGAPAFTNPTDLGMWNALGGTSGKQEVYIAKTTNDTRVNVAMTESSISAVAGLQSDGYTNLPSGLVIKWGLVDVTLAAGTTSRTGSITFTNPFSTNALNAQLTLGITNLASRLAVIKMTTLANTAVSFQVTSNVNLPSQVQVSYTVIGY